MTTSTDSTTIKQLPHEFDNLFRSGNYERSVIEYAPRPRHFRTLEITQILPTKRRLGKSILRAFTKVRPSEAVALAAVLAIGIDVGIFCGLLAQKGEEPNQQALPQAEAPQTPGATEKAPRHDHQKHETTKDKHDVSDKDHPQEAPTTIDITNSGLVAKAIKENQEQAAPDTPSTSPRTVPETETPDPETSAPTPEETPEEPKPTPTNEEPLPTPTDTGESVPPTQEVTPTIKDTGSGTATAMPSSIMSTLVVVQP